MRQHHLLCSPEDVADAVLLVGDPDRATRISTMLREPKQVNANRGLLAYSGYYGNARLTVATTAMGSPSAAIVMEELCNLGASIFIRLGSAGGLAARLGPGDLVVATAAVRDESTSARYLKPSFPAVGDFELTGMLVRAAQAAQPSVLAGIVLTHDAYYRGLPEGELVELADAGVAARDMETSCIFVIARARRVRAAAILVIGGHLLRPVERSAAAFAAAEAAAARIGLEALAEACARGLAEKGRMGGSQANP